MQIKNKTFYETLAIPPQATQQEIRQSYDNLITALQSQKKLFQPDAYYLKLKEINLAFDILSVPESRNNYDAEQFLKKTIHPNFAISNTIAPNTIALNPDTEAIALKAEVLSLRAEAISLRVDALSIKSNIEIYNHLESHQKSENKNLFDLIPWLKKLFMFLGLSVMGWMVIQLLFLLAPNRRAELNAELAAKNEDQIIIQDYYKTHGIKAKSRAEVESLQAQERLQENEIRKAERDKKKTEDDYRRFEEEARKKADQVSANLQYSENKAQERTQREEASKKFQQVLTEQAERARIEREKERWRQTLSR